MPFIRSWDSLVKLSRWGGGRSYIVEIYLYLKMFFYNNVENCISVNQMKSATRNVVKIFKAELLSLCEKDSVIKTNTMTKIAYLLIHSGLLGNRLHMYFSNKHGKRLKKYKGLLFLTFETR